MVNRSKQLIPPIIGGISSFLPTKVSAFCFFSLIYTSCYFLLRTPKPVAITGFQNSDITSDNSKRHWIKTSLASRVSRVRTPDGVPNENDSPTGCRFSFLYSPASGVRTRKGRSVKQNGPVDRSVATGSRPLRRAAADWRTCRRQGRETPDGVPTKADSINYPFFHYMPT